jgi:hypothetical protein
VSSGLEGPARPTQGGVVFWEPRGDPGRSRHFSPRNRLEATEMPSKGKTKARGYGAKHKRLREMYARQVAAGIANCSRCGTAIDPWEPFDLDHTDDRTGYLGPSHRKCNRQTSTHRAARQATRHSRVW